MIFGFYLGNDLPARPAGLIDSTALSSRRPTMMKSSRLLLGVGACLLSGLACAQPVTPGYQRTTFYSDPSGGPFTSLTRDGQGRLYVLSLSGVIKVVEDQNADHVADVVTTFFPGTAVNLDALGILWFQNAIWLSHRGVITRLEDTNNDLVADTRQDIPVFTPASGFDFHQNNDLFTDGTAIFFGLGSSTDHDPEVDPLRATLQRLDPVTLTISTVATGLRNSFDGVFHPVTGDIFMGDNGPNFVPGNFDPPDEVNWVRPGRNYGHWNYWGTPPPASGTESPLVLLPTHAAPTGVVINNGTGFSGYRNELVMATFGGGVGGIVRIPLVYGSISNSPLGWYDASNIVVVEAGYLPIDLEPAPEGGFYVAHYPGRIDEIRELHRFHFLIDAVSSIGTTVPVTVQGLPGSGIQAFAAATLARLPVPLLLGPNLPIFLDFFDPIFILSTTPANGVFALPQPAPLGPNGDVAGSVSIPLAPALIGLTLRFQAAGFDATLTTPLATTPPIQMAILPNF